MMTLCCLAFVATESRATGHYMPGVFNIRDFVVPDPGFYGALYNYFYTTNRINDSNGNQINSVNIGPRKDLTVNVDTSLDLYAVAPTFIWVSDFKILGAKYAAFISPSFANSSLSGTLDTVFGSGVNASTSNFNIGDMQVMPIWLGWSIPHWDFALNYSFYAPIGKYTTQTVTLPNGDQKTVASPDNIGLGFWTNQFQGGLSWYPWADKRMAVATALTYQFNSNKRDLDFTPGQNLTFNWGVSQYIPLETDQKLLLEIGPAGYDSWQTTDSTGSDAANPSEHQQVHAVGGQIGLTYVPMMVMMNFHYFYEYASEAQFQGQVFGLNFTMKF